MARRSVHRNLALLKRTASTSRVLNLAALSMIYMDDIEYQTQPFFFTPFLNTSVILKHGVRRHEQDMFLSPHYIATKIIVPFDPSDLSLGGRTVFVDQIGWMDQLAGLGANDALARDCDMLTALDEIPSLDPFLVREHLARRGFQVAACYLAIADADVERMKASVTAEIDQLIGLAFSGGGTRSYTAKLVQLLLTDEADKRLEPLRLTLKLEGDAYREGIFAWKGFLFYKWSMNDLRARLIEVKRELNSMRASTSCDAETKVELARTKNRLLTLIDSSETAAAEALKLYDRAFSGLINDNDPGGFRDFLLRAPKMFVDLGECVGGISHLVTYWAYRYPSGAPRAAPAEDLLEIFQEFESSLPLRIERAEDVSLLL